MSLIRWSPFVDPFESMEQALRDVSLTTSGGKGLLPAVDVYDTKDAAVVEVSLPGVEPKDIDVSLERHVLTIRGTSERQTEVDEKNYYRKEIRSGAFMRQVPLPEGCDTDHADASFHNGLLRVKIPKKPSQDPKRISIAVKSDS